MPLGRDAATVPVGLKYCETRPSSIGSGRGSIFTTSSRLCRFGMGLPVFHIRFECGDTCATDP